MSTLTKRAVRPMSDEDVAACLEDHGVGRLQSTMQAAALRSMAEGERPSPEVVERHNLPGLAQVQRRLARAVAHASAAVLEIRQLTSGELIDSLDVLNVQQLGTALVAAALSDAPAPAWDSSAAGRARRAVQAGSEEQLVDMRDTLRELLLGLLDGTAYRLAMDPETVVGGELLLTERRVA